MTIIGSNDDIEIGINDISVDDDDNLTNDDYGSNYDMRLVLTISAWTMVMIMMIMIMMTMMIILMPMLTGMCRTMMVVMIRKVITIEVISNIVVRYLHTAPRAPTPRHQLYSCTCLISLKVFSPVPSS